MPEQTNHTVEKRVFCAGLYAFSAGVFLLLQVYHGNFPELFPPLLVFFAAFGFSSFSGKISEKKYIHFIFLLFYGTLILWFKNPFMFALAGGLSAGTFSADAFASLKEKDDWHLTLRDYFAGGIIGVTITASGFLSPEHAICISLAFYTMSVFLWGAENKFSGWGYTLAVLLLISGISYFTSHYLTKTPSSETKKEVSEIVVSGPIKGVSIISLAHLPLDNMLMILPKTSQNTDFGKILKVDHKIISYPQIKSVQEQVMNEKKLYDLMIVELDKNEFELSSQEFAKILKQKMTPHGVVVYLLPDDNLFYGGMLRAAMQKSFKYTKASGKLLFLAASDSPLVNNEGISITTVLEPIFYPHDWEEKTADIVSSGIVPSASNYNFERSLLLNRTTEPDLSVFYRYFPLKPVPFLISLAGLFLLYFLVRYMIAYVNGMGLRFTVFRNSLLFFLVAGFLFFSRSLGGFPQGLSYCAAIQFLLISGIIGCYIPIKYYWVGFPLLAVVAVVSWFLLPCYGVLFMIGAWLRCILIGGILPLMIRKSAEKYKTGTVEPADLLSSTCSGLFAAMLLLAVMP